MESLLVCFSLLPSYLSLNARGSSVINYKTNNDSVPYFRINIIVEDG